MLIKRTSILTGKTHEMEIPVSKTQIHNWQLGCLIQNVMPELTPEEREFVRSGITPDEWNLVASSKSLKPKANKPNLTVAQFIAKFGDSTDVGKEAECFDDASGIELEYAY